MSDARKRALELAKRRAKQRQNITADRDQKEKEKKQRDKEKNAGLDRQQSYLEKQRQKEEQRKQDERDRLQREMDKLKRQQKLAEENKQKKKEAKERAQEEELAQLRKERTERELAEKQKEEEITQLKKQAEFRQKNTDRKAREKTLQGSLPQGDQLNPTSTTKTLPPPTIKSLSDNRISRTIQASKEQLFDIGHKTYLHYPALSGNLQTTLTISFIATPDPVVRQTRERNYLESHPEIQQTLNKGSKSTLTNRYLTLWNSTHIPEIISNQNVDISEDVSEEEIIFQEKISLKSFFWLPNVNYHIFYETIKALSAKMEIQSPQELKILVDFSDEELIKALIDGIHWRLVIPHFEENTLEPTVSGNKRSKKQNLKPWTRWAPRIYQPIHTFSIADHFDLLTTPKSFQNHLISEFLQQDIIRDFLHGISSRSQKYALKSQMFEKSILKLYPDQKKGDLTSNLQNIIDYAEEFGLISVSNPLRYKNGSSQYISITTFGHQKIKNFNKNLNKLPTIPSQKSNPDWGYTADYHCEICGYDLKTDFEICPHCGDIKTKKCRKCQQSISSEWDLCPYCGLSQGTSFFT